MSKNHHFQILSRKTSRKHFKPSESLSSSEHEPKIHMRRFGFKVQWAGLRQTKDIEENSLSIKYKTAITSLNAMRLVGSPHGHKRGRGELLYYLRVGLDNVSNFTLATTPQNWGTISMGIHVCCVNEPGDRVDVPIPP